MEDDGSTPAPHMPEQHVPPAAPPARERSSTGWRWFIGGVVVLFLAAFACSAFAFWVAFDSRPTGWATGDSVALIHLDGVIAGTGSVYNGIITPEYFADQLDQAEADPSVRAILIRVDSPGGTVAASQEIAMDVARVSKPTVVSVGDICASGAYMVSAQCDEIVAAPTSSVGSIGVIAQIPNVAGLLDTLGIEFTVLTAGEYKDAGSPYRSLTATETALFEEYIDVAYREFIRMVAEGRSLPTDEVEEMATGWIWPGMVAQEMGLVDSLGTFNDALDRAAELGGIEGDPYIVTYGEPDYSALLRSLIGFGARLERLGNFEPDADAIRRTLPH
ncbi:MAG: signal peptide peptidase SppA [Coriobacteriia bacterium]|nr:signal peptide peptidase SppA [Coriobacteriia bacterium]